MQLPFLKKKFLPFVLLIFIISLTGLALVLYRSHLATTQRISLQESSHKTQLTISIDWPDFTQQHCGQLKTNQANFKQLLTALQQPQANSFRLIETDAQGLIQDQLVPVDRLHINIVDASPVQPADYARLFGVVVNPHHNTLTRAISTNYDSAQKLLTVTLYVDYEMYQQRNFGPEEIYESLNSSLARVIHLISTSPLDQDQSRPIIQTAGRQTPLFSCPNLQSQRHPAHPYLRSAANFIHNLLQTVFLVKPAYAGYCTGKVVCVLQYDNCNCSISNDSCLKRNEGESCGRDQDTGESYGDCECYDECNGDSRQETYCYNYDYQQCIDTYDITCDPGYCEDPILSCTWINTGTNPTLPPGVTPSPTPPPESGSCYCGPWWNCAERPISECDANYGGCGCDSLVDCYWIRPLHGFVTDAYTGEGVPNVGVEITSYGTKWEGALSLSGLQQEVYYTDDDGYYETGVVDYAGSSCNVVWGDAFDFGACATFFEIEITDYPAGYAPDSAKTKTSVRRFWPTTEGFYDHGGNACWQDGCPTDPCVDPSNVLAIGDSIPLDSPQYCCATVETDDHNKDFTIEPATPVVQFVARYPDLTDATVENVCTSQFGQSVGMIFPLTPPIACSNTTGTRFFEMTDDNTYPKGLAIPEEYSYEYGAFMDPITDSNQILDPDWSTKDMFFWTDDWTQGLRTVAVTISPPDCTSLTPSATEVLEGETITITAQVEENHLINNLEFYYHQGTNDLCDPDTWTLIPNPQDNGDGTWSVDWDTTDLGSDTGYVVDVNVYGQDSYLCTGNPSPTGCGFTRCTDCNTGTDVADLIVINPLGSITANFYLGTGTVSGNNCAHVSGSAQTPATDARLYADPDNSTTLDGNEINSGQINASSYTFNTLNTGLDHSLIFNPGTTPSGNTYICDCPADCFFTDITPVDPDVDSAPERNFFFRELDLSNQAWWQTIGGNALSLSGNVVSYIPSEAGLCEVGQNCYPALINSYPPNTDDSDSPGFVISASTPDTDEGTGTYANLHQDSTRTQSIDAYTTSTPSTTGYSYDFYYAQLGQEYDDADHRFSNADMPDLDNDLEIFIYNGSNPLEIDETNNWNVPSDKQVVVFVDGDLTISDSGADEDQIIAVNEGGFLAFIVSGSITIDSSVGYDSPQLQESGFALPLAVDPVVEGVFLADQDFIVASNGAADERDKKFIGAGSFVGNDSVQLNREFEDNDIGAAVNNWNPTETFIFRPDLVINMPLDMQVALYEWQEVRPQNIQ